LSWDRWPSACPDLRSGTRANQVSERSLNRPLREPLPSDSPAFDRRSVASETKGGLLDAEAHHCWICTWKLKSKLDNGRLETEFEVDQNRVGRRWRVSLVQDGRTVFTGIRRTAGLSGSFELRRLLGNTEGSDRIVARARALATGETCTGALTI
jgi:hypothetical protein